MPNILDIMYSKDLLKEPSFSLCIGTEGGYLTLGGTRNDKHLKDEIKQTITFKHRTDFQVRIKQVRVSPPSLSWGVSRSTGREGNSNRSRCCSTRGRPTPTSRSSCT